MPSRKSSRIQREIAQTVPFRSASQEAALALQRTADVLRRDAERALAPFGVTPQQYNVLRILRGARGEPLPILVIAGRMIERTPGVTRLVDRLEARGWVRREPCSEDRRVVHCRITEDGLALLDAAEGAVTELDGALGRVLSKEELRALIGTLDRIRCALDPGPDGADAPGRGG
jgi:DNA-binding MarR family transcriptional regulator